MGARSQTRIANMAIARLGSAKRILDIEANDPIAKIVLTTWDANLEEVLAAHPWNFATLRFALGADAQAPAFGYAYAYTPPSGFLRWIPKDECGDAFPGVREGGKILTNCMPPIKTWFIMRIDDVTQWSPSFISALADRITVDIGPAITGDPDTAAARMALYEKSLPAAKRLEGMERAPEDTHRNHYSWLDSRN